MEELVNISDYCNSVLVRYGQTVTECRAIYIKEDDVIEFRIKYKAGTSHSHTYQYQIPNFNFLITDTSVLVNKDTIDNINLELNNRLSIKTIKYEM